MEVYTELAKLGVLTKEHREELKKKRGFTDQTIDACHFFSGGDQLKAAIESLKEKYGVETMVTAGLYTAKTSPPSVAAQWLKGVVIPYIQDDKVVYLRCHKMGPTGVPVQMYCPEGAVPSGRVVLAESEFKAAAAWQLGFSAVGIPGIWSFTRAHWDTMKAAFKKSGAESVVVCFDNEDKSSPARDNYKADPMKRYDAQFCSYLMASLFNKADIPAKVATLPDTWMVNGKADIDGAVASGKMRADFEAVFAAAVDPEIYLEGLPDEAAHVVRTKWAAYNTKSRLYKAHNCYWWSYQKDGVDHHVKCSNFTLEILATFDDPGGCNRMVRFFSEHGKPSAHVMISPAEMPSVQKFKEWCISRGNFLWYGSDKPLTALWESLFLEHGDRIIYRPDHVGWIHHGEMWLFGNCAITKNGEIIRPDEESIIYHPISKEGYCAMGPEGDNRGRIAKDRRPMIHLGSGPSLSDISSMLCENFGSFAPAVGVGWVIGSAYSADLWSLYNAFPFLFLFGKRRGGKSTLARYLCSMCGIESEGESIAESTQNYIARSMSYYSSLPLWLEEYRNEREIVRKGAYLRSAYNRASAGKGIKAEFGTRQIDCRSTLLICGEDTPNDPAMLSRCVILGIDEKDRKGHLYRKLQGMWTQFSSCFVSLIQDREKRVPRIREQVVEVQNYLVKGGVNDRTACNWSIPIACYLNVVGESKEFARWSVEQAKLAHAVSEDETSVNQFLEDIGVMFRAGKLSAQTDLRIDPDAVYIRMTDCYNKWVEDARRRNIEPMKRSTVEHSLKDVPGFSGKKNVRISDATGPVKCVKFDLNDKSPSCLRELAGYVEQEEAA